MSVSTIQRIPSVETTSISQNLRPRRSTGISRSDFVKSLMSAEKEKVSGVASHRIDHHKLVALSLSGRGVVTQMVNRMEKKVAPTATKTKTANSGNQTPARKPPLAEEEKVHIEVVEVPPTENLPQPIKKKQKRNYIGSLTSTKFLHNIFSQSTKDEEKKKKGDSSPTILINDEDPHKARMVAISGAASRVPLLLREKPSPSSYESKLKRTLTEASPDIELPLGGPLRKRLSEGATAVLTSSLQQLKKNSKRLSIVDGDKIFGGLMKLTKGLGGGGGGGGGGATRTSCVERRESDKTTRKSASNRMTKSCHIPAPSLLSPNLDFAAEYTLRPLEPRRTDRPIPSLVLQRRATPPKELEETLVDGADENWLAINRRRPLTVAGGPLMRNERRKMLGSRPMSRTLTVALPPQTLPPLYEHDNGDDATSTTARANEELQKKDRRQLRRYGGSHTTSTFQGRKDAAPDASPRRHLIGFLHRTSHLSLTSEMSGNASFYLIGHRRHLEESTLGSESDARMFSDDDDRGSTTTDFTSVSRQHEKMARKRRSRRNFRRPSRASSFSSITESSMSLDVITVTLNMDTVNFLGISIVGQTSTRGDNGIYVANIMKGGAVALDGRIEAGDMILQVNDISFENFTNDQAVDVLRDAVSRRGPIKLTVAKCFENGPKSCFTIPRNSREEPVRPIDTQAWIQHTNAMRGMPSIIEGSEGAPTPIPGEWPHGRPASSSTVTSTGSNGQNTVVGQSQIRLDIHTDKKKVVEVMAMPASGLDIKNRTWLKIPIPMSFLGSDLVEWLLDHVEGLRERKDARKYASDLLKQKLIAHVVNKITFTEQCYYVLGDDCADFARYRNEDGQPKWQWTAGGPPQNVFLPAGVQKPPIASSMVSGYASMPVSPYPVQLKREGAADMRSQASGASGDGSSGSDRRHRNVILPPNPSCHGGALDAMPPEMSSSRQSFRIAMNHPYEFFVDNL